MGAYTIHAGHAKDGNKYCGAAGYCKESTEARKIKDAVIKYLKAAGHSVYDCTVDSGTSQSNVITQIKSKINSHKNMTANISIHLNALSKSAADGKTKGTEVCVYATGTKAASLGSQICVKMKELGFTNRGVKAKTNLGVLKGITNGGDNLLVECFFCDDQDDYNLYQNVGVDAIGKAIAEGIVGKPITVATSTASYFIGGIDYSPVFNPTFYSAKYDDLKEAFGSDTVKLWEHFKVYGMKEARQASASFDVLTYKSLYTDLQKAFGSDLKSYYKHYCEFGKKEGRRGI